MAIAEALRERSPELYLDLEQGERADATVGISWSHDELEQLLDRATGDDILFAFDRDQLQLAFDDVEAHGLRERALVFTIAVAGALGSSAAIANAAPTIERDSDGAPPIATVQALATDSVGGITSNVRTPGLQIGDETSATAPASSVRVAATDTGLASNVHTPGLQIGDEGTMAAAASVKLATEPQPSVVDDSVVSNVHTPGLQIGPGESTGSTGAAVKVSGGSSDGEFLGVDTRDATEALIAGGVLLAIAGATFAGTRRPGSARPASGKSSTWFRASPETRLTPRVGDPNDLIFAFDAKGRPPQDMTIQVVTPVTFTAEYTGAPIDKVGVVEVYGTSELQGVLGERQQGGRSAPPSRSRNKGGGETPCRSLAKSARSLIRPPPATAPVGG